ncbi:MAG: RNA polymerase sigma factor [Actinomycetota bacterium]
MSGRVAVPPFTELVEEHRAMVHRFLTVAVGPLEADDCFQETFLAALRAYPRLEHADALDRWLLRIATRKALDHHRGRRRRPEPSETVDAADAALAGRPESGASASPDLDDPLWSAVASLPPRQRAAVVHRYVLDLPYAEIGRLMESSTEAARANVAAAMRTLRSEVSR